MQYRNFRNQKDFSKNAFTGAAVFAVAILLASTVATASADVIEREPAGVKKSNASATKESVKKIVRTAEPHGEHSSADDTLDALVKAKVVSEPAPGTRSKSAEAKAHQKTASNEAAAHSESHDTGHAKAHSAGHAKTHDTGHAKDDHGSGHGSGHAPAAEHSDAADVKREISAAGPAKKNAGKANKKAPAATPAPHPEGNTAAAQAADGVSAETSLRWLSNGNTRYVKKGFRSDGKSQADRDRTSKAEKPHAIVLGCADSRVAPEIVFDQAIGEIFTVRAMGEALDSSVIASIEHAIETLKPRLLVVLGHTQCSAVAAALGVKENDSAGSEALDKLLGDIRPRLKTVMTEKRSVNLEVEGTLNADGITRELPRRSEIIRKAVESGELTIKPALYWIETGKVKFY